ncbi:MAG: metallophosphoesterase family protein [Acidimicrobiales bacterium]
MIRFGPTDSPPQVWAVEDHEVQITWGRLPPGHITAKTESTETTIEHVGGPGGMNVGGLQADSAIEIALTWDGGGTTLHARTMPTPPGELLARFATISDLHLGAYRWGAFNTMIEKAHYEVAHPYRCASAAVEEALSWGAEMLIIKGDAAQHETASDFAELGRLVDEHRQLPMLLIPGNHDVDGEGHGAGSSIPLTVGERQLPYTRSVDSFDLPGAKVIVADTSIPMHGRGDLARTAPAILDVAAASDRPVFIGLHHQLQATRLPRYWPIGINVSEANRFLAKLNKMQRPVAVSSGHTHRNRSRLHGDVLVTEVGSTKDWPGVWAGYAVYEGGIRQVVRRIMRPDAIVWTEYSRGALNGLWAMWSPGPLDQRCLSHPWVKDRSLV